MKGLWRNQICEQPPQEVVLEETSVCPHHQSYLLCVWLDTANKERIRGA
jgi:hypothetical protein